MRSIVFIDTEINSKTKQINDFGAINTDNNSIHSANFKDFKDFISDTEYICGHNIVNFDLKYLKESSNFFDNKKVIDTLYWSPILFPKKPYHKLVKDDKIFSEEKNNPLNDSKKAMELFFDEINAFNILSYAMQKILGFLLKDKLEFKYFFEYLDYKIENIDSKYIKDYFSGKFCSNSNLDEIISQYPVELAYVLSLINIDDKKDKSILPSWVQYKYPKVDKVINILCNTPCDENCDYCKHNLDIHKKLKDFFDYDEFRTFEGEKLQENACQAAVNNKSLIAIFPTGGGKSLTFQLPALISGYASRSLTVVISPLQSLMKDQIDNLEKRGIVDAVAINGLLNPIERKEAFERIKNGIASILYISPEQLRSKTIEKLLLMRNVSRFVIDEAHCFSSWGQDFRVDYLYIGDFIKKIQDEKNNSLPIQVSCFTATAKQKVIADIVQYFEDKLNLKLELYASNANRTNLKYMVRYVKDEDERYKELRDLLESKTCPTIVYVSSVRATQDLAERLNKDGFSALPYNGKMLSIDKRRNQESFINDETQIIVATSAFGMGVDKKDVGLVIHYNISASLEEYMQESGRAAREQSINADCYILYSVKDLDKHFVLLNQTKTTITEIQQVWHAIKNNTKYSTKICKSAYELARLAGLDFEDKQEAEIKVKTALLALEKANYITRGQNVPRVYATSINAKTLIEAKEILLKSQLFNDKKLEVATNVVRNLISSRSKSIVEKDSTSSRIDWIADNIGADKKEVLDAINLMREIKLLDDESDMVAYINLSKTKNMSKIQLSKIIKLENYLLSTEIQEEKQIFSIKEINERASKLGIESSVSDLKNIINFWTIKSYINKQEQYSEKELHINLKKDINELIKNFSKRVKITQFILDYLITIGVSQNAIQEGRNAVSFSLVEIFNAYNDSPQMNLFEDSKATLKDIEDALLYLKDINAISLEGGFLVLYNSMEITRLILDNKIKYKKEDYKLLDHYYKQKIQQIHIIGEFLDILVKNYNQALKFVQDYFQLEYHKFISKYFKERIKEISINMTPGRYRKLFGELSDKQKEIILDNKSKYIVVAAGPGSGKTKVLVHKLASLLTLEDIKSEQLLMLTFSRASAIEFKTRLQQLIGNAAYYVEIKTFHSYCFDLIGRIGNVEKCQNVVLEAIKYIKNGLVEPNKIAKSVLVIDEAQDMSQDEFNLIEELINYNDDLRIIAVGDDDQNIYEFRGSNSKYLEELITKYQAKKYEMVTNYRSSKNIVELSNEFRKTIKNKIKENGCVPYTKELGKTNIIKYNSKNMELALIESIKSNRSDGTTAILTNTNYEALRMLGALNKENIPSKLIQSLDGFDLNDLFEISYIFKLIKNSKDEVIISDITWDKINKSLCKTFSTSECLKPVLNMLKDFEKEHNKKYISDLENFFSEIRYEDYCDTKENSIIISTIHKSKGHEYDNVYMLLNNVQLINNADKRKIYVGMTRAKNLLEVHYNNKIFDFSLNLENTNYNTDRNNYSEPEEIVFQLTHKDVILDYFLENNQITHLRSGYELILENDSMYYKSNNHNIKVLKLSKNCKNKLEELKIRGYKVVESKVRFIVFWYSKVENKKVAIVLPDIILRKG